MSIGVPTAIASSTALYFKLKRDEYLSDPVLTRAIAHLKKDYRVVDFCGQELQPAFMITREKRPGENWVKYDLTVRGAAGKLKIKVIGDHLTHEDLHELESEKNEYFVKVQAREKAEELKSKQNKGKKEPVEVAPIDIDYIPVDFDAYSIIADTPALQIADPAAPIDKSQKVWRISSLTAQVDDDTRILVLPVPESKRVTKIAETSYSV